jgi:phosphate transport system substrate-binding protein
VNTAKLADNAALGEFVDYYLSDEGIKAVTDVGYVALPSETLEATRTAWEAAK